MVLYASFSRVILLALLRSLLLVPACLVLCLVPFRPNSPNAHLSMPQLRKPKERLRWAKYRQSERCQLSQAIAHFHVERMLHD